MTHHADPVLVYELAKAWRQRLPDLEPVVAQDAQAAAYYAADIIMGPFDLAEPTIARDAHYSEIYRLSALRHGSDQDRRRFERLATQARLSGQ